jgi:hypothetical protein
MTDSILNQAAVAREIKGNAEKLLALYIGTRDLGMAQNHTAETKQPQAPAGKVDPTQR